MSIQGERAVGFGCCLLVLLALFTQTKHRRHGCCCCCNHCITFSHSQLLTCLVAAWLPSHARPCPCDVTRSRNRLLRIEILLTVATFALAIYNLVAGILGENLVLPELWTSDLRGFIVINIGTFSMCVTIFFVVWRVMVAKKMI